MGNHCRQDEMTQQLSSGVAKNMRAATVGISNNPDLVRGPLPPALLPTIPPRSENAALQERANYKQGLRASQFVKQGRRSSSRAEPISF